MSDQPVHTALPWEQQTLLVVDTRTKRTIAHCTRWEGAGSQRPTPEIAERNAAFIVRACNNFDALLAALKEVAPPLPRENALCHAGICTMTECEQCQRSARAYAAIEAADKQ